MKNEENSKTQTVVLGGGCFWCLEAVFSQLKGATKVESGYSGGNKPNPDYKNVCSGNTGQPYCQAIISPKVEKFRKTDLYSNICLTTLTSARPSFSTSFSS